MKIFHCDHCGNLVFFENVTCLHCSRPLGFLPDVLDLSILEPADDSAWRPLAPAAQGKTYRSCANGPQHAVCNWLVPAGDPSAFCWSCRLNELIPDLAVPGNRDRWHKLELAKRRLLYTLLSLRLPLDNGAHAPLRFHFLSDTSGGPPVQTSHQDGLIIMNTAEADDDERERRRLSLHEPFRTLLGHFRHEIGHYYWNRLIQDSPRLGRFRELFGNERLDYQQALQQHYAQGPAPNWASHNLTAYASAHPWEDWAETWAHYLHMVDTIETAASFGLSLRPTHPAAQSMTAEPMRAASSAEFGALVETWIPLTYALNSLNRGMGLSDLYPFVLPQRAIEKLRWVHEVIAGSGGAMQTARFQ